MSGDKKRREVLRPSTEPGQAVIGSSASTVQTNPLTPIARSNTAVAADLLGPRDSSQKASGALPESAASAAAALIDQHRTFFGLNINEEALGELLAKLAREGAPPGLVPGVFAALGKSDRAQVASAMILELDRQGPLDSLVRSDAGFDVVTSAAESVRPSDWQAARIIARAFFPPPPGVPERAVPHLSKADLRPVKYEHLGIFYDLNGKVTDEKSIESVLSPIDFIGGFGGLLGRQGLRLLLARDLRAVLAKPFPRTAPLGTLASGVFGAAFNIHTQYKTVKDLEAINWGGVATELVVSALFGAYLSKVMVGVPLRVTTFQALFTEESLAILVRQQGLLAPAMLLTNFIRAEMAGRSNQAALLTTAVDAVLSVPLNGIVQFALQGSLGNRIFGRNVTEAERLASWQAVVGRALLGQFRQYLSRSLIGLNPGQAGRGEGP